MTGFFAIGAAINIVAFIAFIFWAVKAWKRADPKRHQEKRDSDS